MNKKMAEENENIFPRNRSVYKTTEYQSQENKWFYSISPQNVTG